MNTPAKLLLLLLIIPNIQAHLIILVHGTFATQESWHRPGGDFYQAIQQQLPNHRIHPFVWSGKFDNKERLAAGQRLASLVDKIPISHDIIIIGHSHGGNVALIATMHCQRTINHIVLLGTPIMPNKYQPNIERVHHLSNLFSLEDFIQPLGTMTQRILSAAKCCNIRLESKLLKLGHQQLHHPLVAQTIPAILSLETTEPQELIIHAEGCSFKHDTHQANLVEQNRRMLVRMIQFTIYDGETYRRISCEW